VDLDFNLKTAKALGLTILWTKAVNDIWLADQAFEGIARAIETGAGLSSVQRGKPAISELAEASLLGISKAIGGASFSRSSPFGQWSQDVRALIQRGRRSLGARQFQGAPQGQSMGLPIMSVFRG
jgi:hypothetical protein